MQSISLICFCKTACHYNYHLIPAVSHQMLSVVLYFLIMANQYKLGILWNQSCQTIVSSYKFTYSLQLD